MMIERSLLPRLPTPERGREREILPFSLLATCHAMLHYYIHRLLPSLPSHSHKASQLLLLQHASSRHGMACLLAAAAIAVAFSAFLLSLREGGLLLLLYKATSSVIQVEGQRAKANWNGMY